MLVLVTKKVFLTKMINSTAEPKTIDVWEARKDIIFATPKNQIKGIIEMREDGPKYYLERK